jgi:hypothetical protein
MGGGEIRATGFLRCDSGLGVSYAFASLFHYSWGYAAAGLTSCFAKPQPSLTPAVLLGRDRRHVPADAERSAI